MNTWKCEICCLDHHLEKFYYIYNDLVYTFGSCDDCRFKFRVNKYNQKLLNNVNTILKNTISSTIRQDLKKRYPFYISNVLDYLPYSIFQLKEHLEKQFEPWMNWTNRRKYISQFWDDNNSSTWRWNIDHIIPKSNFNYKTVIDEDFQKCWALENLRPYSAKQNIIDGTTRIRHFK